SAFLACPESSRVHFGTGNDRFAAFRGDILLQDGALATDFRPVPGSSAKGKVVVTLGTTSPRTIFSKDITFAVSDNDPSDNREKWTYSAAPTEKVTYRWKDTQAYDSTRDVHLPSSVG